MRQVRRKTSDPSARAYLLKAKKEGIALSWNRLEEMMPQDGFALLGLTCHECLQGPCRLNPFRAEETATICGLTRDDLVFNGLFRRVSDNSQLLETAHTLLRRFSQRIASGEVDQQTLRVKADKWGLWEEPDNYRSWLNKAWELTAPAVEETADRLTALLTAGARNISLMELNADLLELLNGPVEIVERKVGLGVLNVHSINVCLDGVSPAVLDLVGEVADELRAEAIRLGASGGYNVVLAGDFSPFHDFAAVGNQGAVEFALLSGTVDLYLAGLENTCRGRNLTKQYHTVSAQCPPGIAKENLRKLFRQAAEAFQTRDKCTVEIAGDNEVADVGFVINPMAIKQAFEKGIIKGICIIAGGSNVKVTADEMAVKLVKSLIGNRVLCLTYGNTAVTIGRYGYLSGGKQKSGTGDGVSLDNVAYCLGGELAVAAAVKLAQEIGRSRVAAVFPEMMGSKDLQSALAFAKSGVQVFTGTKLPIEGSADFSSELGKMIQYCHPKEIDETVGHHFSR